MSILTKIFELFIKLILWVWKKVGIKGILALALLIEAMTLFVYYVDNSDNSKQFNLLLLQESTTPEKLESKEDDVTYYRIDVTMKNHQVEDIIPPSLHTDYTSNVDRPLYYYNYYNQLENNYSNDIYDLYYKDLCCLQTIPAGVTVSSPYIIKLKEYDDISVPFYITFNPDSSEYDPNLELKHRIHAQKQLLEISIEP